MGWADGTNELRLRPVEYLARLAAIIPRRGRNRLHYHGVFAPAARLRGAIVPSPPAVERHPLLPASAQGGSGKSWWLPWADLLSRVFVAVDGLACDGCQRLPEDVQLLSVSVTQAGVAEALGAAAVEAAQQHADSARHATEVARDAQRAAADAARQRSEVEAAIARAEVDAERATLAQAAASQALMASLALQERRAEAEVAQERLRMAVEAEKDPAVRAHELAMLQATAARDALNGVAEARVVHVGGGLVDWLGGLGATNA